MLYGSGPYSYKTSQLFLFLLSIILAYSCATIVQPSGGPKDETPPVLVRSTPRDQSVNFKDDRIVLGFDEYIEFKDLDKNLLISPPLNKDPEFRIKGRSVIVRLTDTLRVGTTYNFYLGDAIVDITERNPLSNFSFAFSTGSFIDSLSLKGKVTDAFTQLPVKDALVMLYLNMSDSAPMLERPVYVTRSVEGGAFIMKNLAAGEYRIVALKDGNNDYLYSPPSEGIGFSDSLVQPVYHDDHKSDSTLHVHHDESPLIMLGLFKEPDSLQRLLKGVMTAPHLLSMYFRYPLENPEFTPINLDSTLSWSVTELTKGRDTVSCWLIGPVPDSLFLRISDRGQVIDTLEVSTHFKPRSGDKSKEQVAQDSLLQFSSSVNRTRFLDWNSPYMLTFQNPLESFDISRIRLIRVEANDTLQPNASFSGDLKRSVVVEFDWRTNESYMLLFAPGAFTDIYGRTHDTVISSFRLRPREEYGQFKVNIQMNTISHPLLIQLTSEKGAVINEYRITESQKLDFGFLYPGKYGLKAVFDSNYNGKWDTGNYLRKIQPERIAMHPKVFEVRGNWELEEEWLL